VVEQEGVTLLRTYAMQAGVPGLRLFYPRLWRAMRVLQHANADVYLANGSGIPAGWAYHAAQLRRSKFVFFASSDGDADRSLPWLTKRRERWWYLTALRGANARVAQTEFQRRLFRQNFGVETEVIANPMEPPSAQVDAGANSSILWLSTYKPTKRPEWFTELASRLPDRRFVMVGMPGSGRAAASTWEAARHAADALSNLEVHGFVEHSRVEEFLRESALFVHTSPVEGFPMTLLEAWAHGIPTVSAVDPGGIVTEHKIGDVVTSVDGLVDAVALAMFDPDRRRTIGARARRYVQDHHGADRTYEPLAKLLDGVIRDDSRTSTEQ
jgi:glycosyltransferase involved in cell wall biosynthesis